jgi:DNA-3-methyladenine glycosylase
MSRLARSFFDRPTVSVARDLLGQRLVHVVNGRRLAGLIAETEAYVGETDLACHARAGRTPRTAQMYGPAGHAYVYFNYGMHWMLNVVCERDGFPAAVLIRSIVPIEGLAEMRANRGGKPDKILADGPGKLCQALAITSAQHGADLCARDAALYVEAAPAVDDVVRRPRIGIDSVPEPWRSIDWNFTWPASTRRAIRPAGARPRIEGD